MAVNHRFMLSPLHFSCSCGELEAALAGKNVELDTAYDRMRWLESELQKTHEGWSATQCRIGELEGDLEQRRVEIAGLEARVRQLMAEQHDQQQKNITQIQQQQQQSSMMGPRRDSQHESFTHSASGNDRLSAAHIFQIRSWTTAAFTTRAVRHSTICRTSCARRSRSGKCSRSR